MLARQNKQIAPPALDDPCTQLLTLEQLQELDLVPNKNDTVATTHSKLAAAQLAQQHAMFKQRNTSQALHLYQQAITNLSTTAASSSSMLTASTVVSTTHQQQLSQAQQLTQQLQQQAALAPQQHLAMAAAAAASQQQQQQKKGMRKLFQPPLQPSAHLLSPTRSPATNTGVAGPTPKGPPPHMQPLHYDQAHLEQHQQQMRNQQLTQQIAAQVVNCNTRLTEAVAPGVPQLPGIPQLPAVGGSTGTPPEAPVYPTVELDAQTESNHDTALTLACANGHADLVSLLLGRGADIEHRDKKGKLQKKLMELLPCNLITGVVLQ
jgi:hypothetical protein